MKEIYYNIRILLFSLVVAFNKNKKIFINNYNKKTCGKRLYYQSHWKTPPSSSVLCFAIVLPLYVHGRSSSSPYSVCTIFSAARMWINAMLGALGLRANAYTYIVRVCTPDANSPRTLETIVVVCVSYFRVCVCVWTFWQTLKKR